MLVGCFWLIQINHGLPQRSWLPDFPLTLLPWQQSPDGGTLNWDTWVLLISHVESLGYFPSPITWLLVTLLILVLVCPHLGPWLGTAGRGTLCCVSSGDPVSQPVGAYCIVTRKKQRAGFRRVKCCFRFQAAIIVITVLIFNRPLSHSDSVWEFK